MSRVHDFWARVVVNPLFATTIPNIGGLIDHEAHSLAGLAGSYAWFLAMSVAVWEGNRALYFRLSDARTWLTQPGKRLAALVLMIGACTVPIITAGALMWASVTGDPAATWRSILWTNVTATIGVMAVVHVYETVFLIREWESDRLRSERLEREKVTAELEALQREVDPHALFNMLNALAGLVESRNPEAVRFAEALADAYRRMLRLRRQPLVDLTDEIALLQAFVTLHELRAPGALTVQIRDLGATGVRIPPMVLPELLENAVKHNTATREAPVEVTITRRDDTLIVSSSRSPRGVPDSHGVGLRNLENRCRLATGRHLLTSSTERRFEVHVPLLVDGATSPADKEAGRSAPIRPA